MKTTKVLPTLLVATSMLAACGGHGMPGTGGMGGSGGTPDSYSITIGPIMVPSGTEKTQCIVKRLGNTAPLHVGSVHNVLGDASHHMVVYRVNDASEQLTPFDCLPLQDLSDPTKGSPVMITQKHDDTLNLPAGVAYTFDANQMIRIELHYINATPNAVELSSTTTVTAAKDFQYEANFLLIGDLQINVPAMSDTTLGPVFYQLDSRYADVNFFGLTGHEHKLGKNVQVAVAANAMDNGQMVYDVPNFQWSEPALIMHDPPFKVPTGGGFRFSCQWHNPTMTAVQFGESANDEMCFFWAYYYPSKGTNVCFHSTMGDRCIVP